MYFWNYQSLALLLYADKSRPPYYAAYCVLFVVLLLSLLSALRSLCSAILLAVGVAVWLGVTYRINRATDNNNYVNRLVCFSLPAAVRTLAVSLIFMIVTFPLAQKLMLQDMKALASTTDMNALFSKITYLNIMISFVEIASFIVFSMNAFQSIQKKPNSTFKRKEVL